MLYLFTGTDTEKIRAKAFAWVEAARKKAPEAPYVRIDGKALTAPALSELVESQGLFFLKLLVLIDEPFTTKAGEELLCERLDALAESANAIALLAPGTTPAAERKLEKYLYKTFREDIKEKKAPRGFNGALVNALAVRDGKKLWLELEKTKRAGEAPEAVHGLLHWKARDLMQKGSRAWNPREAQALSVALIELVSNSRRGERTLYEELERFALSL